MRIPRSLVPALAVAILALVTGGWFLQQGTRGQESVLFKARLLEEVHRLVSERYVEEIDPAELYQMAIDGMLREVGDPYSVFLTPEDFADLQLSTTGNYGGLGIRIQKKGSWITVMGVLPNTPAERRGLQTGDRIVEVDGESAEDWTEEQAVNTLRGEKGSSVTISVARVGVDRPLTFTIERDAIHVKAIESFMLDDRVGYVRLGGFNKEATKELRSAIEDLRESGAQALLLDLRWNTGGLLDEGVAIADLFLPRGAEVVSTRSRLEDQNFTFRAAGPDAVPNLPLAVLVNEGSASASEILAGALQDYDRALVLGTATFGKGSVQSLYSLPGGNHLKLTTARWYTPSGRSIHKDRRDEDELLAGGAGMALSAEGTPIETVVDTAGREVFRTVGGRPVYGGGGITPDLIVLPDTATLREREFVTEIAKAEASFVDAAFQFGVRWKVEHPDLEEDFEVTPAMRDAFYRELVERIGGGIDRALYDDARGLVDQQLAVQIANAAFGETARLKRRLREDRQVEEALRLLREADSPGGLFTLAAAHRKAAVEAASAELDDARAVAQPPH
ncbi:MAG: S41 family peptidase [Gemmatimonadota bacterium]